jgi:hypothetical protein
MPEIAGCGETGCGSAWLLVERDVGAILDVSALKLCNIA